MAANRDCTNLSRKDDREIEHEFVPINACVKVVGDGCLLLSLKHTVVSMLILLTTYQSSLPVSSTK